MEKLQDKAKNLWKRENETIEQVTLCNLSENDSRGPVPKERPEGLVLVTT